ncbi:hypothetical protein RN001_010610 [Aquatica leii]|uniref:Uncharacterized protein n=1 Tax=Aquatica leii TaxID=1421715 RepID=A0AAN7PV18_9COLE|nr:hypothetical protein RN001_010610 [Aquatica leii]
MNPIHLKTKIKIAAQILNNTLQEQLKIGAKEAPKYINRVKDEIFVKKVTAANNWYTRILGLDEVKFHQQRVVALQEKLLDVQEQRREISHQLIEIRKKSNELQEQLHKVKRQEELQRFLDLMKEETEILKKEMEMSSRFSEYDREEREIFTAFTNAVKDSHEKQRAQLEYTKYFGIILSILGSFFTFCYSTFRKQDLKRYIDERLNINVDGNTAPMLIRLKDNQKQIDALYSYMNSDSNFRTVIVNNQTEILKLLNGLSASSSNSNNNMEFLRNLQTAVYEKIQAAPAQQDPILPPVVIVGGAIVLGFLLLRSLIG